MEHFYKDIKGWMDFQDIYSEIVEQADNGSHFVEIGAWFGKSTAFMGVEIINSGKDIQFDVVDTWRGSPTESQQKIIKQGVDVYKKFIENLKPCLNHESEFMNPIRMDSVEASKLYDDQSLDFVFIDGNHLYYAVKADIEHWLPKIKPGGVIAGHDWFHHPEVQKAVRENFSEDELQVKHRSWFIQLPKS